MAIKIVPSINDNPKMYGKHFDHNDLLVSHLTRRSLDVLKEHFRDELSKADVQLLGKIKLQLKLQ